MSKIKVNTIEVKCGSTLTLGGCGQTVQLAAGAVNGIPGGVDWETTSKTADFTAEAGKGYFVDTSSNEITVTLPASPSVGDSVTVLDFTGSFDTNACVFNPGSEKIEGGGGQGATADKQALTLTYSSTAQGWLVSSAGDSGPLVAPTITFDTASGSIGLLLDTQRSTPNDVLDPVTATATFGTLNYSIQSGALPSGLTLNSSTGAFVGTAAAVVSTTTYNFTVRATISQTGTFSDRAFSFQVQEPAAFVTATGGTVSTCGDYKVHAFTGPGTFCVSCAGNSAGSSTVEYIIVGAGASGGGDRAGGGGAGGLRHNYPSPDTGGLAVSVQGYPVSVGGGGPGSGNNGHGKNGGSSSFACITSAGGGGGGAAQGGESGNSAGSGGGGSAGGGGGGSGNSPPVSPPQGNPGGSGQGPYESRGGGGGGHTSAGSPAPGSNGGPGGNGTLFPFVQPIPLGSPSGYFAGGGGGGRDQRYGGSSGPGGLGGGTTGNTGSSGTANTGGGSGGGGLDGSPGSGNGGSGIVVIRYKYQ